MQRLTLLTVTLTALAGSLQQTTADAGPPVPGPLGRPCSYVAATDPSPEAGEDTMTGSVVGGPLVADPGGTLHCRIRVNGNTHASGGVAAHAECEADWTGVIVCGTWVAYVSAEDSAEYMCASYDKPGGGTIYWHPADNQFTVDPTDDEPGHWSNDANTPCASASQVSTGPILDFVDSLTCPTLARSAGPGDGYFIDEEGDVFLDMDLDGDSEASYDADWFDEIVWDCPVYTSGENYDLHDNTGDGVVDYTGPSNCTDPTAR